MNTIMKAARVAAAKHAGQFRKYSGAPYVQHPARVAGRVMLLPNSTEEMVVAAFLHDVVEDTDTTLDEVRERFGEIVATYVDGLTHHYTSDAYPDMNRAARKRAEQARLAEMPVEVRTIKLLDRIDNLGEMDLLDSFTSLYMKESQALLDALRGTNRELEHELRDTLTKLAAARQVSRMLAEQGD
jgi:(p)ppGpp synthase/HD superfamily hydrolase